MRIARFVLFACFIFSLALLFSGCETVTIPPKIDLTGLKVAVFPFSGVSNATGLETELQMKVINRISSIPNLTIIDESVVKQALRDQQLIIILKNQATEEDILKLSEDVKADFFILGGLTFYQETFQWDKPIRTGRLFNPQEKYWSVPQITTVYLSGTLRVVDGKSGKIVWMSSEKVDYSDRYYIELPWDGANPNPPPPNLYGAFDTSRVIEAREMAVNRLVERLTRDFFSRKELR